MELRRLEESVVTQERVRELLDYSPDTGRLTWRRDIGRRIKSGQEAGGEHRNLDGKRYRRVSFDGKTYYAHCVIFMWMEGRFPGADIDVDHKDGDGLNNRWSNLREATDSQNHMNQKLRINSTVGKKGICYDNRRRKWRARIKIEGKDIHLGYFIFLDEAVRARSDAANLYHGKFLKE